MSTKRRLLDTLLHQGTLAPDDYEAAAKLAGVYPSTKSWFDLASKALLVVSMMCFAVALVFFVAYNWFYMGKFGKFALVQSALVISIAGYVVALYKASKPLVAQLFLLTASIITGGLLALFGQIYQTGADTWQLFFSWAALILLWVVLARFWVLWLLFLTLLNVSASLYVSTNPDVLSPFFNASHTTALTLTALNTLALMVTLYLIEKKHTKAKRRDVVDTVAEKHAHPTGLT